VTAREYLFSLEQFGIKLGLEQISALLAAIAHPERTFPSILVAGTNGKGSVTAMLERGFRRAGYHTGRYTSPHLIHLEERFALDGEPIAPTVLDESAERIRDAAGALTWPPSFFEATTALALDVFRSAAVDIAILEVGLGGRLDATNAVDARAVAITAIDLDHEAYLGRTLDAIAAEKAGVIKAGSLVVLGENREVVADVISERCRAVGARLVRAVDGSTSSLVMTDGRARMQLHTPRARYADLTVGLRGRHQAQNALTAIRLLEEIDAEGWFALPVEARRAGIENAVWPGRLELRQWGPTVILLDGAHNPSGARALAGYLEETYGRRLPLVVGVMRDKDATLILQALLPAASCMVFTAPRSARAAAPEDLSALAHRLDPHVPVEIAADPLDAIARLSERAQGPIVVAGSLYLVGEVRAGLS
jgi:dihydrofolate synthase/folylpolyglutamate synthase